MFSLLAREKPNQTGIRLPATCIIFCVKMIMFLTHVTSLEKLEKGASEPLQSLGAGSRRCGAAPCAPGRLCG